MTTQELLTSLQAGLEYAQECLAVHDRDLGRTTPRNKRHAEEMAQDIVDMRSCIEHIQANFGSNVSLPQPKELDAGKTNTSHQKKDSARTFSTLARNLRSPQRKEMMRERLTGQSCQMSSWQSENHHQQLKASQS